MKHSGSGAGRQLEEIKSSIEAYYIVRIDSPSGTITYIGKALAGTATSAATWQIKRIEDVSTETIILFADGNTSFDNVWNDRASLTYS
jgi:hypothetical protein